jgi:hypothetical protein
MLAQLREEARSFISGFDDGSSKSSQNYMMFSKKRFLNK